MHTLGTCIVLVARAARLLIEAPLDDTHAKEASELNDGGNTVDGCCARNQDTDIVEPFRS